MTIATVVTRGYGIYSDVNFLPPHGYETGSIPTPGAKVPFISLHISIGIKIMSFFLLLGLSSG